jgi:protein phosphatase
MDFVTAHGQSHIGNLREENQDAIRCYDSESVQGALHAVADGIGGYSHGGIASALVLETFFDTFFSGHPTKPAQNMRRAAETANVAVYQKALHLGGVRMGTTLSAVNIVGDQLHIAHIGDSRVYLIRNRKAICLTRDHTTVGDMVQMRVLTPDKVRSHEARSVLTKCLGIQLFAQPDITRHTLHKGDVLILCTDGVWSVIEDDEFAELAHEINHPHELNDALINLALERESDDNASAISIKVHQLASVPVVNDARPARGLAQFFRSRARV